MGRETGCQPLGVLDTEFPKISDADTPETALSVVLRRWPDATLRPYLDAEVDEHKADRSKSDIEELKSKSFTPQNALLLSSRQGDLQLLFLTEDLCRRIGGLPKTPISAR
jgi:hypothetical protein